MKNKISNEAKIHSVINEETGEKIIPVKMKYVKKMNRKKVKVEKEIE